MHGTYPNVCIRQIVRLGEGEFCRRWEVIILQSTRTSVYFITPRVTFLAFSEFYDRPWLPGPCYEWFGPTPTASDTFILSWTLRVGRTSKHRGRRRLCRKRWFITKHNNGSEFSSETLFSCFFIFLAFPRTPPPLLLFVSSIVSRFLVTFWLFFRLIQYLT
jgi:hypothetical protein